MIDISDLEERHRKAASRAEKAKFAYENAKIELERVETALAVVREMSGATTSTAPSNGNLTKKQQILINSLKSGQNNALSPVDIYHVASQDASFDGDVNYVRTTLWRMADKGAIGSANGTYWKFVGGDDADAGNNQSLLSPEVESLLGPTHANEWGSDDDSDLPF